jgi:Family of unknown function (DUF5761)
MGGSTPNFAPVSGDTSLLGQGAVPNGRINLISGGPKLNIPNYQQSYTNNDVYRSEATAGIYKRTPLSDLFFSAENIDALQEGIRYRIYVESDNQYVIGRQSDTELKIVMRSIFIDYARHDPNNLVEQVRELNKRVLDWVVPEVLTNIKQYYMYRRDASTLPMPMERASLMTSKGTRVLEVKSFF